MSAQTTQPFHARESSSSRLEAVIKDEDEVAIPAASLGTMTLMLYDQITELASPGSTSAIINGRNRQDVLNANGCTIDASGNMVGRNTSLFLARLYQRVLRPGLAAAVEPPWKVDVPHPLRDTLQQLNAQIEHLLQEARMLN